MASLAPSHLSSHVSSNSPILSPGILRGVHHIALNVKDMKASCHFYGNILGLHKLTGDEVPATLIQLVAEGKVTNFKTPDGTILDLFWEPDYLPPDPDPHKGITRRQRYLLSRPRRLFNRNTLRSHGQINNPKNGQTSRE